MDPNPLPDVDPDAYVEAETEVADLIRVRRVVESEPLDLEEVIAEGAEVPRLPRVGDYAWHEGKRFRVSKAHLNKKLLPIPQGDDRICLQYNIVAWVGDVPYEDPTPDTLY